MGHLLLWNVKEGIFWIDGVEKANFFSFDCLESFVAT